MTMCTVSIEHNRLGNPLTQHIVLWKGSASMALDAILISTFSSISATQQENSYLTLEQFDRWLERYFEAWRSNDPTDVMALFAEDAVYHCGPFVTPTVGRRAIVERWVSDPGQQQEVQTSYKPLAVNGDLGIAHWRVTFRREKEAALVEADGILVITFDGKGRCVEHQEWFSLTELHQIVWS
jgi:hypothetical protein